jgi:hypothetical protein
MDSDYRVHLAHPTAIRKYDGLKHNGDFAGGAYLMAQLLRLGLLEGYVYPREDRGARDLDANACNRCNIAQRGPFQPRGTRCGRRGAE